MKKSYLLLSTLALSVALLSGCGSQNKGALTVNPNPNVIIPDQDNMLDIDTYINVPADYVNTRSRLFITPTLMVGDSTIAEYHPVVLDGEIFSKKQIRRQVLNAQYRDPYQAYAIPVDKHQQKYLHYKKSVQIPSWIETGRIIGVVSKDGCGMCSSVDTVDLALVTVPTALLQMDIRTNVVTPEIVKTEKVHHGKGEARLLFEVDKWDIKMDLANNRQQMQTMRDTLMPILTDSLVTLNSMNIQGYASADASYSHNMKLATKRAEAAKEWLLSQFTLPRKVQRLITIGATPEGWEPVVQAMYEAGDPDSIRVRQYMNQYPGPTDDAAEKYIKQMESWQYIADHYLAKDRRVTYDYTWTVRSFDSDDMIRRMYALRPDAFSDQEFYRMAQLCEGDDSKKDVYETMLRYYPNDEVALNNLALLYLDKGRTREALKLLDAANPTSDQLINTMAVAYLDAGRMDTAEKLLETINSADARYNLGLIKARKRDLKAANELLSDAKDTNAALLALCVNDLEKASNIMYLSDDLSPRAEYIRAMIAARSNDQHGVIDHLANAVADDNLRMRAIYEPDFTAYRENPQFKQLIGK